MDHVNKQIQANVKLLDVFKLSASVWAQKRSGSEFINLD